MTQAKYDEAASLQVVIWEAKRQLDEANDCAAEITNTTPINCDIRISVYDHDYFFRVSQSATQCILQHIRDCHETRRVAAQKDFENL